MKKIRLSNKFVIISLVATICGLLLFSQRLCAQAGSRNSQNSVADDNLSELLEKLPLKFVPRVGKWVRYRLTERNSGNSREVVIGVDKAEDIDGRVGYWIEISTSSTPGVPVHLRFLYDPRTTDEKRIRRFIVKADQHPAVEVDTHGHTYMLFDSKLKGRWHKPQSEKTSTPAGIFEAQRVRFVSDKDEAIELWLSERIPLTGLLRATSITQDFELIEYGDSFKAIISDQVMFKLSGTSKGGSRSAETKD